METDAVKSVAMYVSCVHVDCRRAREHKCIRRRRLIMFESLRKEGEKKKFDKPNAVTWINKKTRRTNSAVSRGMNRGRRAAACAYCVRWGDGG